jgi:hypothetical protein
VRSTLLLVFVDLRCYDCAERGELGPATGSSEGAVLAINSQPSCWETQESQALAPAQLWSPLEPPCDADTVAEDDCHERRPQAFVLACTMGRGEVTTYPFDMASPTSLLTVGPNDPMHSPPQLTTGTLPLLIANPDVSIVTRRCVRRVICSYVILAYFRDGSSFCVCELSLMLSTRCDGVHQVTSRATTNVETATSGREWCFGGRIIASDAGKDSGRSGQLQCNGSEGPSGSDGGQWGWSPLVGGSLRCIGLPLRAARSLRQMHCARLEAAVQRGATAASKAPTIRGNQQQYRLRSIPSTSDVTGVVDEQAELLARAAKYLEAHAGMPDLQGMTLLFNSDQSRRPVLVSRRDDHLPLDASPPPPIKSVR